MVLYSTSDAKVFEGTNGHRPPVRATHFARRVVSTTWRELTAPDGSVHRIAVPLVAFERSAEAQGDVEPYIAADKRRRIGLHGPLRRKS